MTTVNNTDTLKRYILECNVDSFINEFERISKCLSKEDIAELYAIGYANRLLLNDYVRYRAEYIPTCRSGISKIMEHLEKYFTEPKDYRFTFMGDASKYDYMKTNDAVTWPKLQGSKEDLLAKGYRDIDVELFISAFKLRYKEVENLLALGARPDIFMSATEDPEEVQKTELGTTLITELDDLVYADMCTGEVSKYWDFGQYPSETFQFDERDLFSLNESASVQMMLNLVSDYYNLNITEFINR